ncbi:MAG: prephenate dehydrogenase/arogenate dehydrogenase family protein [Phycisphaerae bacterium]|nr:prephenate dehydrogenase/arogenate dehydrogenase family protein [Phycisphaerae bacterium]
MINLKQISVIGMGLLGASVTLAVKRELPSAQVIGYSHRAKTRQKAREAGVAHEIAETLQESVKNADIVILATPIQTFKNYFLEISRYLKDGCIVTDVGSTKLLPHHWAKKYLPKKVSYVGSHPIAGSEKRGVEFARDDLLTNARCILTKTNGTSTTSIELLRWFWSRLGCTVIVMSPENHDRILGRVSHLPHLTAAALVNANTLQDMKFAGRGFIDTTRVASGPADIWTDILMTNPANCVAGIERLITQLRLIQDAVRSEDKKKIEKFLTQAARKRAQLIQYKIEQKELF